MYVIFIYGDNLSPLLYKGKGKGYSQYLAQGTIQVGYLSWNILQTIFVLFKGRVKRKHVAKKPSADTYKDRHADALSRHLYLMSYSSERLFLRWDDFK